MGRKPIEKDRLYDQSKKNKWVKKLLPLFKEKGLKGYSMDEMASYLEISKATIYNHFKSKDEIVDSVIQLKINELKAFEDYINNINLPFLTRYFKGIQYFTSRLSDFSNLFLHDLQKQYPLQWQAFSNFQNKCIEIIKEYYQEGIRQGVFNNINLSLLVMSDRIFFQLLSVPEYLSELNITLEQAFEEYFKMKFNGLLKDEVKKENYSEIFAALNTEIG